MTDKITIEDIRVTLSTLVAQLDQYKLQGDEYLSKFAENVSAPGNQVATEAVINDLVGESVATPGAGLDIVLRVIQKRESELTLIKNAKDKITEIAKELKIVGSRLVDGN